MRASFETEAARILFYLVYSFNLIFCSSCPFHLDKSAANIEGYKLAKKAAKRAVNVAKGKAYDDLYQRLGTKEGEKDIYRMVRIRERKTRDINQQTV